MRLFSLGNEDREWAVNRISDIARPVPSFYALTALSTLIASFGLVANSTAVVIGAMLVAPLMGPIFGLTLGLVLGKPKLIRNAVVAEASGVVVAIALACLVGLIPLKPEFGSEILGRTAPTVLDLAVALVSGIVGAYCMINKKLSETIAGVAIATAIVPPLATCGLCLAAGLPQKALGAFVLFGSNFLAIQFAATLVFMLSGIEESQQPESLSTARLARMLGPGLLLLTLLGIALTKTLSQFVDRQRLESFLRAEVSSGLRERQGAQLDSLDFRVVNSEIEVTASVLTPKEIGMAQVAALEARMEQECGRQIHLVVRSLLSRDVDRAGTVYISDEEKQLRESEALKAGELSLAADALRALLLKYPGAQLGDVEFQSGDRLLATIETPSEIGPEQVAQLEEGLVSRAGRKLRLVVRSIITRDADAERYIYTQQSEVPTPRPEHIFMQAKLETMLRTALKNGYEGFVLSELSFWEGDPLIVQMTARGPRALGPAEVKKLQTSIEKGAGGKVRLTLRTQVEALADQSGYLTEFNPPEERISEQAQPAVASGGPAGT